MLNLLLSPLAILYRAAVFIRHKLFDWGVIAPTESDIPVVCVGNITVGGTGKTPMSELLIEHLAPYYHVALLSRGYKRRTKGFVEVQTDSPFLDVGDEPKQIKLKFPEIVVAVCRDRREGIARIRGSHPEVDLVILDDGFQYRRIEPWINVVLMDYNRPTYDDHMLPRGRLRDLPSQMHRADIVVVTKCPDDISPLDIRLVRKYLGLYPYQSLWFSSMRNGEVQPLFADCAEEAVRHGSPVIVMAGVASPGPLLDEMGRRYRVVDTLIFPDHHPYRMRDLDRMRQALRDAPEGTVIVTTEKDAVKLTNRKRIPAEIQRRLYYVPVHLEFLEDGQPNFLRKLYQYVKENQKHGILHS